MVSVDLDITFLIQLANFLIAMVVLNFVLVKPIRKIMKERRDMVAGLARDSESFNSTAEARLNNYEAELDEARTKANAQKEQIRQQGLETEHGILESAQSEAQHILQKSRKDVAADMEAAMQALRGQVNGMAERAVARILS
ncbi:ATP synthase F0 subunit B [Desulfovibrio sp. OttesenSCG-928-C06]|nr:ATP synthase F0 subunit B [Desulfovibrio sp. OttesenSCG-928-C06]